MIRKNAFANLLGRLWGIISLFAFVPAYISYLGETNYGYIGFYATLMALLSFADLGFSSTTTREFARLSVDPSRGNEKANLLFTYEILYLGISSFLLLAMYLSSSYVSSHWLNVENSSGSVSLLIFLMGACIAVQLPSNLYIGALMGTQLQVQANVIQVGWGVLRAGGVIFVLEYISNTLYAFFIWQLLTNVIYLIVLHRVTWGKIEYKSRSIDILIIKNTYRYSLSMAGMGVLSSLVVQIDKLAVSKTFSIEMVGYYSIAATFSLIPLILITTIAKAVFPKFTAMREAGDLTQLNAFYSKLTRYSCLIVVPLSFVLAGYSKTLLQIWTKSESISNNMALVVSFLMMSQMLQALTVLPYYLSLGYARVRASLAFSVVLLILIPILIKVLLPDYGVNGVAMSVMIANAIIFIPYMVSIHRKILVGCLSKWFAYVLGSVIFSSLSMYILTLLNIKDGGGIYHAFFSAFSTYLILILINIIVLKISLKDFYKIKERG